MGVRLKRSGTMAVRSHAGRGATDVAAVAAGQKVTLTESAL